MTDVNGLVLCALRDKGALSRAALSRQTGLSGATITHTTARLLQNGLVGQSGTAEPTRIGRPGQLLHLDVDARHMAGVHIGAGSVQIVLTDLLARQKSFTSFDFDIENADPKVLVTQIAAVIRENTLQAGLAENRLLAAGIAVPGPVDAALRVALASMNLGWTKVPVAALVEEALGVPAVLEHNVTAMAVAEGRYGLGYQSSAMLFVYLKTGLGAGLMVNGAPFRSGGLGGMELGHIQVAVNGARCVCGNVGCLETFLCEKVLMHEAGLSGKAPEDLLARLKNSDAGWMAALAHLTSALGSTINLLTPDMVVLGGYLGEAPLSLIEQLRRDVPARIMPHLRDIVRFEQSGFGFKIGAVGAAAVALDHFFYSGALT